jgi:hypothetical protein
MIEKNNIYAKPFFRVPGPIYSIGNPRQNKNYFFSISPNGHGGIMDILTFFYENGLWLSWPSFGLGVFLLWFFIATVIKVARRNRICSLPLTTEQNVEFSRAGKVILWLEGPLFTTRFGGLSFELKAGDGSVLKGRMALLRQGSSSFSKARIADRIFSVPHPGAYVLHAKGLGAPKAGDEQHGIIFMRPYMPQTIGCILGILLGAFLCIGSIVNFFLRLSQGSSL